MPIKIKSTGGGSVSIDVPNTGSDFTLTAPANNSTLFTTDGGTITGNVAFTSNNVTIGGSAISPAVGMRNRIINGDMRIWQRGTSFSPANASTYCADRWFTVNTTSASQNSDVPNSGFSYSIDFSNTAATYPFIAQRIEAVNCAGLAGGTITISFWAKNVSGSANLYWEVYRAGSADNYSTRTYETGAQIALSPSTSWTFYTSTLPLSAAATTGIEVCIIRNNASASQTRVTGVQLEVGSVATPFERRSIGMELALCQRYYFKTYPQATVPGTVTRDGSFAFAPDASATNIHRFYQWPVTMRAAPSVTGYNPDNGTANQLSTGNGWNPFLQTATGLGFHSTGANIGQGGTTYVHLTANAEL